MSKTHKVDPQAMLRTVDTETNLNLTSTGAEDQDQSDYLQLTGNGVLRRIELLAKNDNSAGDKAQCPR